MAKAILKLWGEGMVSYWYCPNCKIELDGCHVTYEEKCEYCGSDVLSVPETISQEELDELIKAKADGRVVVLCPKCKYAGFSKTTAYAYVCKNRLSPCRDRTTTSDFGCVYGQKKEIEADVVLDFAISN